MVEEIMKEVKSKNRSYLKLKLLFGLLSVFFLSLVFSSGEVSAASATFNSSAVKTWAYTGSGGLLQSATANVGLPWTTGNPTAMHNLAYSIFSGNLAGVNVYRVNYTVTYTLQFSQVSWNSLSICGNSIYVDQTLNNTSCYAGYFQAQISGGSVSNATATLSHTANSLIWTIKATGSVSMTTPVNLNTTSIYFSHGYNSLSGPGFYESVYHITNGSLTSTILSPLSITYDIFTDSSAAILDGLDSLNNSINQGNQLQQESNDQDKQYYDSMTDKTPPSVDGTDTYNAVSGLLPPGPIDSMLSSVMGLFVAPVSSCSPISLPLPSMMGGSNLILPCMSTLYPPGLAIVAIIINGIIVWRCVTFIINKVRGLTDTDDPDEEVI
jgi:hypothetical protein